MMNRRTFLAASTGVSLLHATGRPTQFQIACMTLPYAGFPFERALSGIKNQGFQYVAWGIQHLKRPVLEIQAAPVAGKELATRCRSMGLEPVMMFSAVNFEAANALDAHRRRIDQAQAGKVPFIITFGKTSGGEYDTVIGNLKGMAEHAKGSGVTILIKQHGGNTATGEDCARILRDVAGEAVSMCYDAGNVLDYENRNPIEDIHKCWRDIRAFAIKDHRNVPKDEDCGIGFGEIDHYKLLAPIMRTGLTMPLAFENIFEPLLPRPTTAEGIDRLARRSREYLESVLTGLENQL